MHEPSLSTEVQYLKGVGPRLAVGLQKAGLLTVDDVLHRLPRRYEDRSTIPPISSIRPGQVVTVHGRILRIESKPLRGGMVILKAILSDGTGAVALTWFNQPWIKGQLEKGSGEIFAYGQAKEGSRQLEIASPEWEHGGEDADPEEFGQILPVYPLTDGLAQRTMRRAVRSALSGYLEYVREPLPLDFRKQHELPPLKWSLQQIHLPDDEASRIEARRRLVFEEFFYMQVAMAMKRAQSHQDLGISFPIEALVSGEKELETANGPKKKPSKLSKADELLPDSTLFERELRQMRDGEPLWDQIHRILPFDLTRAQRRVINEIWSDMSSPHPMNRLVQGDVGSGKTAVAEACLLAAVRSGFQGALMAPTEILAEQHFLNLKRLFLPLAVHVTLLVGKLGVRDRRRALNDVALGSAHIVVGTHALIQDDVKFANLGLVIVDEQHRFGVLQRKALRDKSKLNPDVLVMTATPIPRTLTMAIYGDLDLSVIDELPPGRQTIKTHSQGSGQRPAVYEAVRKLLVEGRQAYFVCPMVSESEKVMAQAAEDLFYRLNEHVFPEFSVDLLHGQMKARDKELAMEKFRKHETDVLVSTTVIEVGVDVANASVMVIEDANRFGLSQLHQLRGRVGRGPYQSYCVLIADSKSQDAKDRMDVMTRTNDGFEIAEADLRMRGPGIVASTQQSGVADFKFGDLYQDGALLERARQAALEVVNENPKLSGPEWVRVLEQVRAQRSELAVITVS